MSSSSGFSTRLAVLAAACWFSGQAVAAAPPAAPAAFQAKGFTVLGHERESRSGLNVWTVHHPASGKKLVLYSTPKNEVFFTGAMWDGISGGNISDVFFTSPLMADAGNGGQPGVQAHQAQAKPGALPGSIKRLSELASIKEGDAPAEKTLYIFFDPICPYCKQLYEVTRNHPSLQGRAIAWIPVAVIGQKDRSMGIIADILQRKQRSEGLQIAFSGVANASTKPSTSTLNSVKENEAIFWAAFQANPGAGQPAVPVAFFMDKTGRPQMVPNPTSSLTKIFQEMN